MRILDPQSRFWIVPAGSIRDSTIRALAPYSNSHRLLDDAGNVRRDPDTGQIAGLRYSIDGSQVILRYDYGGPGGRPPDWVLDALEAAAIAGPMTGAETREYLHRHRIDWYEGDAEM